MPLNDEQRVLSEERLDIAADQMSGYADAWERGEISLADFERLFKQELKDLYIAQAWTARGSIEATTQVDYGRIGRRLRDQYQFMHGLFEQVGNGELSLAQIKQRMKLFANSSGQILEQIGADEPGLPTLPAYPRDGSTQCKTNDKCTLRVEPVENGFDVFWELHPAEHCPDCTRRANGSPLRVRFGQVVNPEAWL